MNDFEKRFRRNRRIAYAGVIVSWALVVILFMGIAFVILHPEVIGDFAGRIVNGYHQAGDAK